MATQYQDTVENILEIVSDLRGESSTNTDASRIRAVSRAEYDIALRRFWKVYLKRNTTTMGDGTNDYTIGSATYPMRLNGLAELFVDGTTEDKRYQVVDFFKFVNLYNRNNAEQIAYEWYDQTNDAWKVHINPAPDTGVTITYSHFYLPPKRTATGDIVITPSVMGLARLALAYVYEGEDEVQKAQLTKAEAEQLISDAAGQDQTPAVNTLVSMGAVESQVTTKGFGSY